MNIQVREMQAEDVSATFLETLGGLSEVNLTVTEAIEILQARRAAGFFTFVALVNGRLAGTASLVVEQKFIHHGGKVGHIEDVVVHESHRRQGIGTALVQALVEVARSRGCYKCILNCFAHLVPFYTRIGFKKHDECLRINL